MGRDSGKRIRRGKKMWPTICRPLSTRLNARWPGQAKRITVLWVVKRCQLVASLLTVEATEASGAGNMAWNALATLPGQNQTCCPSLCRRRWFINVVFQMPLFHFCQLCCFATASSKSPRLSTSPLAFASCRSRRGPGRFYQSAPASNDALSNQRDKAFIAILNA